MQTYICKNIPDLNSMLKIKSVNHLNQKYRFELLLRNISTCRILLQ